MKIRVAIAGATGWTGQEIVKAVLKSDDMELVSAIARKNAGADIGEVIGVEKTGVKITSDIEKALSAPTDVLVDYTKPDSVKERAISAIRRKVRVVIGTSGLSLEDFKDIERNAIENFVGVIAAGNFSITAALAKHFSLLAAKHLPSWEIVEYFDSGKEDAPSGTVRELAEALSQIKTNKIDVPIVQTRGFKEARGASIEGTQVHSVRLPGYVSSFETHFGLPNERLSIKHDSGNGADPYVAGTLLAIRKVMETNGLIRGLDQLLFH